MTSGGGVKTCKTSESSESSNPSEPSTDTGIAAQTLIALYSAELCTLCNAQLAQSPHGVKAALGPWQVHIQSCLLSLPALALFGILRN